MPSYQGTQNIGSGNDEHGGPGISAFLVVEHNGQKVAINDNLIKAIVSIKKSIHELRSSHDDQIILLGFLAEVDDYVQITGEVWTDLLPRFLTIRARLGNVPKSPPVSSGTGGIGKDDSSEDGVAHIPEGDTPDISFNAQRAMETLLGRQAAVHPRQDDEEAEKRRQQQIAREASTSAWTFLGPSVALHPDPSH